MNVVDNLVSKQFWIGKPYVLLDVEGTTTSISFVRDTLFPYVRENLRNYIDTHWDDDEFKIVLSLLMTQSNNDVLNNVEGVVPIIEDKGKKESVYQNVLWQMDNDRKTPSLKLLQGHIWRLGYRTGRIKGHVYDDVAQFFSILQDFGYKIFIYSSGSVEAQELLFENSVHGNLCKCLSGHFDTGIGAKADPASYSKIAERVKCTTKDITFMTDVPAEADAAQQAGCNIFLVERPGNAPIPLQYRDKFPVVSTFAAFLPMLPHVNVSVQNNNFV